MVCSLPELSLELNPSPVKISFPDLLTDYPIIEDSGDLINFVDELEKEIKKIQAFQRELPLSFQLLNDAIGKFKEKVKKCEKKRFRDGKFGENVGVKLGNDVVEKKDWMSSVQLWLPSKEEEGRGRKVEGGAISSFKQEEKVPKLSLVTPSVVDQSCSVFSPLIISPGSVDQTRKLQPKPSSHSASRKQRRCWSPELHRRFTDALEKLGGSQVATPKQIRELMQVDGLTNDEVKSHLQKYRLHIRKLPAAITKTPSSMNQEMAGDTLELGYSNSGMLNSGSPEFPSHFAESKKCNSSNMDEDEEDSDGHSWKAPQHA